MEWVPLTTTGQRSLCLNYSSPSDKTINKKFIFKLEIYKAKLYIKVLYCKEIPTKPAMS